MCMDVCVWAHANACELSSMSMLVCISMYMACGYKCCLGTSVIIKQTLYISSFNFIPYSAAAEAEKGLYLRRYPYRRYNKLGPVSC